MLMSKLGRFAFVLGFCVLISSCGNAEEDIANTEVQHPVLITTAADIAKIRLQLGEAPLFEQGYKDLIDSFEVDFQSDINVPYPKDAGGGFTHEQHKRNYKAIYNAGFLYQVTGEQRYADRGRDILVAYADMYPTLGLHPEQKEQSPGKLFWQSLNEAVWLLYSIQGYDYLYDGLTAVEREHIETNLFREVATYLSDESPQTFDRIHNHGTWAAAAVGMTGYVLGEQEMVEKALYGLDQSGKSGFLKQMDQLFSPDGYYTEGPYYQRYALMPFILFAKAIDTNEPEREIFEYRDQILLKAIYSAVQLSYNDLFFPINDALKDKGLGTIEMVHGMAIAYGLTGDNALLPIARAQGQVEMSGDGLSLAKAMADNLDKPFPYQSIQFRDGELGDQGALSILRSGNQDGHQTILMKNTSQGLGHGHFDKLGWIYYDNGNEIVTDYGAARFLNIESKYGGHYLPENLTWAKQTIAHNTLVVDEQSHFNGKLDKAQPIAPTPLAFDIQENIQIAAAEIKGAYEDVDFTRTMAFVFDESLEHPLVIDVLRVNSDSAHQYDLPIHYQGHIVNITFPYEAETTNLKPLGEQNGYQHLWRKAVGKIDQDESSIGKVTWIKDDRFYTNTVLAADNQELIFTELGANDPNFNLRRESAVIQRINGAQDHTFVSVLETHGEYNPVSEYTLNSYSQISNIQLERDGDFDLIRFESDASGKAWILAISYDKDVSGNHKVNAFGRDIEWTGFYSLVKD